MKPRRNGLRLLFVLLVVVAMFSVAAVAIAGPKGARPDRPFKAEFSGTREFGRTPDGAQTGEKVGTFLSSS
jgi:hypothetical protein